MAERSKTRIKDMSVDPHSIKLPEKYRIDQNAPSTVETVEKKNDNGGFETLVDRLNKKKPKKPFHLRQSHHRGHGRVSNWICVKNIHTNEVLRVRRIEAETKLIPTGKYQYTSKTEWRNFLKSTQQSSSAASDTRTHHTHHTKTTHRKPPNRRSTRKKKSDHSISTSES